MDQPKIERMLRLMKMMSGNTNYTIEELASKLGMSYRSEYRYIDTFKASGFIIDKLQKNVYKVGKMPRSHVDMSKLIYFSEEEAYLVNSMIDGLHPTNQLKIDLKKKECRVFKISRINSVVVLEDYWTNEDKHQKSKTDCFRMSSFEQSPVKLELSLMAKNLLLEEYPLAQADLKEIDGKWILDTMVSNMAGVGRFVIGLADEVKIIDSPALVEYIKAFVNNYLNKN